MKFLNPEIRIENTNLCNSNCIMCPREKLSRKQGIMDWSLFCKVVDDAVSCGATHVFLGGFGEPMIDHLFMDRINYVKSRKMTVSTITNASLLNQERVEDIIKAGVDSIRISFYGLTQEVYETVHKGLSFDVGLRNVKNFLKQRNNKNKVRPEISISFLLLKENAHQAVEFKEFWKEADFVEMWHPHNFLDGRVYRERAMEPRSCCRPWRGPLQVQWDGIVIPCCFDYNNHLVLGDLKVQTIEEVMHSQAYDNLRRAHKSNDFKDYNNCAICDQLDSEYNPLIFSNDQRRLPGKSNSNFFKFIE